MTPFQTEIDRVIALANRSVGKGGTIDDTMQVECFEATLELCKRGLNARLSALDQCHRITNPLAQHRVVGDIIAGCLECPGIESAALQHLANSSRSMHWDWLAELAVVFEREVSRAEFRNALGRAWRKAEGVTKENLAYALRRRGFKQFFGRWV
jgi:hypothetical protein